MKSTKFLAAALALATVFTSCIKEGGDNGAGKVDGNTTDINIVVNYGGETKATGGNIGHETPITISSGKLYFTDATGVILKTVNVVTSGTSNENQINVNGAGVQTIGKVPAEVEGIYMACNVPTLLSAVGVVDGTTNISDVEEAVVTVKSQYVFGGGVSNVAVWGADAVTPGVAADDPYEASITLNPLSARIEIDKFTLTEGDVTQYIVDGIFVNNYYTEMNLNGTAISGKLQENDPETDPQNPTIYKEGSTEYPSTDNGVYYDYKAAGIGTAAYPSYNAGASKTWAYNLLAPASAAVPKLVIRFTGFAATDAHQGNRYITVKGFKTSDGQGGTVDVTELVPGNIYRIKDFKFTAGTLATEPEAELVDVEVEITVAKWLEVEVEPEI